MERYRQELCSTWSSMLMEVLCQSHPQRQEGPQTHPKCGSDDKTDHHTRARTHTPQEDMEMFIVYIMRLSVGNKVASQTGPGMAWERAGVWGFVIVR